MEKTTINKIFCWLIKIDRLAAWVLLFVCIAYGITGYGMTKGLIDQEIASNLHLGLLGLLGIIAFIIHTAWAIHLALKRHCIWNIFSRIMLVISYVSLTLFFGYVHFFYQNTSNSQTTDNVNTVQTTNNANNNIATIFTKETLKQYNGLNGQAAYVAVDGIVYDMSKDFRNGVHHGYSAGQDLSAAFHAEHPNNFLNGLNIVGTYQN